jgi:F0F1-type ATP synthase membrane subunit c/vacuolar-type H+-ATPase subunit K
MNNDVPESLRKFEAELERAIKRRLEFTSARRKRARPRILAGTTLGLAGLGAALALAFTAASTSPAFAVTRNHDGSVSVRIVRLSALPAVNARLAAMKIHARLVPVVAHCPRPTRLPPPPNQRLRTRIKPWRIPRGRTLVIAVSPGSQKLRLGRPLAVAGPVPACLPPPPIPCPVHARGVGHPSPGLVPAPSRRASKRNLPLPACRVARHLVFVPAH